MTESYGINLSKDIMVPMRDRVRLATDLYRPARDGDPLAGPFPTILCRTPYDKTDRRYAEIADFFTPRGYVTVLQDLRGRQRSEGVGEYFHVVNPKDGNDGYDTVEWIAAQRWSNGRVGTVGSLFAGLVQTRMAFLRPPHLTAIWPDVAPLLADRPDVLVFRTPPLEAPLELTGPIRVNLWISSTAPDTDFTAKLIDEYPPNADYPEGYHLNLVDSIIRTRYRESWEREVLMTPGRVYPVTVRLPPTSNVFAAGHCLRVDISSSNFPRLDVNPNTGEPVGRHTRMQPADNTVYLDRARSSHAILPIIPAASAGEMNA